MRKLLVLAGLAGAAAVVAKKLKGQQDQPVWHTPDTDSAADTGATADDSAGAGLDEAIADSVEEPHRATTPDAPLEEVIIETPPADA